MYTAVHARIEEWFQMRIQGKRYNHYRDMTNWKPFHHDAAGLDKDAGHLRKARERRGLQRRHAVRAADRAPQRRVAT